MKDTVKTTRFEPSPCPGCGRFHDAATDLLTGATPTTGSIVVCIKCAAISIYADDRGQMRKPTETELKNMKANAELWKTIQRHRLAVTMTKAQLGPLPRGKDAEKN